MSLQSAIPKPPPKVLSRLEKMTVEWRIARAKTLTESFISVAGKIQAFSREDATETSARVRKIDGENAPPAAFNYEKCAKLWVRANDQLAEIAVLDELGALDRGKQWFATRFNIATHDLVEAYGAVDPHARNTHPLRAFAILAVLPMMFILPPFILAGLHLSASVLGINNAMEPMVFVPVSALITFFAVFKLFPALIKKGIRNAGIYAEWVMAAAQKYLAECDREG